MDVTLMMARLDVGYARGMTGVLTDAGYRVLRADSVAEIAAQCAQEVPALLLLQVMALECPGALMLRELRQRALLDGAQVVVCCESGAGQSRRIEAADWIELGAHGVLMLPISATDLLARVKAHLKQRELHQRLLSSEAAFRRLITHQVDGVLVLDLEGRVCFSNPAAERMLGIEAAELDGKVLGLPLEGLGGVEIELRGSDDPRGHVVAELRVTATEWQGIAARLLTLHDITRRKAAEREADDMRYRVATASRLARLGAWQIDASGTEQWWSDEVLALLDADHTLSVREGMELISSDALPVFQAALDGCLGEGKPFDMELPVITLAGRMIHVRILGQAQRDEHGRILRVQGAIQDVSERHEAELRLRESEDRLRSLMMDIPSVAIQGYTLDGTVHYWNRASELLYGYSSQEAHGRSLLELIIPAELRDFVANDLQRLRRDGVLMANGVLTLARKDGSPVTVYSSHALLERTGREPELYCIDIDLSERMALEEQLRQAQRMESIGHLTGGIAHDFNNLLTVILGNAELMLELLAEDAGTRPMAAMILSAAQRGADLTRSLLTFAGRQALQPQCVDVNALVKEMHALLRHTLGEDVELTLRLDAEPWQASVDPGQLESALLNLCLNARDAMPAGGKLCVETGKRHVDEPLSSSLHGATAGPGDYVAVWVHDSGSGIDPGDLARVFEPFFTTKTRGKGTGLGLPMVYGFARQSGGQVSIESTSDQGTSVRLLLPRDSSVPLVPQSEQTAQTALGGDERILLVEDDDLVRSFAYRQLGSLGYRVSEVANGPLALNLLREDPGFDLLFTDVVMPGGMNGRQLADAARALYPQLRVLYSSGYAEDAIVHDGRLDRGVRLLSKPYRLAELARHIREALDGD